MLAGYETRCETQHETGSETAFLALLFPQFPPSMVAAKTLDAAWAQPVLAQRLRWGDARRWLIRATKPIAAECKSGKGKRERESVKSWGGFFPEVCFLWCFFRERSTFGVLGLGTVSMDDQGCPCFLACLAFLDILFVL